MVKQDWLQWLADNPFYTKRFAFYVGRRCRSSTVQDVSKEWHLNWKTVEQLEKQSMREQLRRAGAPGPKVIGIDEVSIRRGHTYRIVVSDLLRHRPSWFGGKDRSEDSMDVFFQFTFMVVSSLRNGVQFAATRWSRPSPPHTENQCVNGPTVHPSLLTCDGQERRPSSSRYDRSPRLYERDRPPFHRPCYRECWPCAPPRSPSNCPTAP